jgi:hypothetical protein
MSVKSCKPCDYRTEFDKRVISIVSEWALSQDTDPVNPKPEAYKKKINEKYSYNYSSELTGYENNTIQTRASCPCNGRQSLPNDSFISERYSFV